MFFKKLHLGQSNRVLSPEPLVKIVNKKYLHDRALAKESDFLVVSSVFRNAVPSALFFIVPSDNTMCATVAHAVALLTSGSHPDELPRKADSNDCASGL